jgi:hypothetical protein
MSSSSSSSRRRPLAARIGLARAARAAGVQMIVCASGAIPRQPGDGIKTDTRDALRTGT